MTKSSFPSVCDYLVVGAGATGMAFVDSLVEGYQREKKKKNDANAAASAPLSIVLLDRHDSPGGQWHDSYAFVRLHQPSKGYGVESEPLEPSSVSETKNDGAAVPKKEHHRASRLEILHYYQNLQRKWENNNADNDDIDFCFIGNSTLDFDSKQVKADDDTVAYQFTTDKEGGEKGSASIITIRRKLVDARYLQPDLPITVPPKFTFDPSQVQCVPVNDLYDNTNTNTATDKPYFVIIGAGKTGMDAVSYLLQERQVDPTHVAWVAPHRPWITAREEIGNCMEFLHDLVALAKQEAVSNEKDSESSSLSDLLRASSTAQKTFLKWEKEGKIYRLFPEEDVLPTKFQDATLNREELTLLRQIPTPNLIRGQGRVQAITNQGDLVMSNGTTVELPWKKQHGSTTVTTTTTFVHCSAGAFNYSLQIGLQPRPVFEKHRLTIQDVYGTPGFCFVGSLMGKLESLSTAATTVPLTDEKKNDMCRVPQPPPAPATASLGPSGGGDVTGLSDHHGYVQRLLNLRDWLHTPQLRDWLVGHRLFNMGHYSSAEEMERVVQDTYETLSVLFDGSP